MKFKKVMIMAGRVRKFSASLRAAICSLAALLFLMFGVAQAQSQEWAQWGGPHEELTLPFKTTSTFNGEPAPDLSSTVESVAVNSKIDPAIFEKPKAASGQ